MHMFKDDHDYDYDHDHDYDYDHGGCDCSCGCGRGLSWSFLLTCFHENEEVVLHQEQHWLDYANLHTLSYYQLECWTEEHKLGLGRNQVLD